MTFRKSELLFVQMSVPVIARWNCFKESEYIPKRHRATITCRLHNAWPQRRGEGKNQNNGRSRKHIETKAKCHFNRYSTKRIGIRAMKHAHMFINKVLLIAWLDCNSRETIVCYATAFQYFVALNLIVEKLSRTS